MGDTLIRDLDEVLKKHGYPVNFRDLCEMFYDQGYMDTFYEESFDEYFNNLFYGD